MPERTGSDRSSAAVTTRTDDELMLMVGNGQAAAFETLFRRHHQCVLRQVQRNLSDVSLASDVVQSTFLELFRNRQRYQPRGKFKAYLRRIALNQSRMIARVAHQRAARVDRVHELASPDGLLVCEHERDLRRALARLTEKQRAVIVLRYSQDLPLDDVAALLGVPLGTVKRRLFDAVLKLRTHWQQCEA